MAIVKYFGHAAFEVRLKGFDGREKIVLIDPWLSNPLSPVNPRDYVRETSRLDYIIVTHDHGDHLGDTEYIAKETGARVVAIFDLAVNLSKKEIETIDANVGGRIKVDDLFIVLTPAIHSSSHGNPVGVVVGGEDIRIYHAGDTGLFAEMQYIHELYNPDIALLPIGGHYTMGVEEAAKAVELLKPKIAIPMHYNTFPPIKADPTKFKEIVEKKTSTKVVILKPGEQIQYP